MTPRTQLGICAVIAMLLAVAAAVQARLEAARPVDALESAELYVRSAKALDRAALSYDALLADVYWMRAIQHFGGERRSSSGEKRFALLYPLLDLTTSLDPYFNAVYYFGAFFLAEPLPGGAGRPDLAIRLLERGAEHQPDAWRFPQQIGFVHYWYRRDYDEAATWFRQALSKPGAPQWLAALEATTRAEGGDLESSRRIWREIAETPESEDMRAAARFRLMQVEVFAAIDMLERLVQEFAAAHGRVPSGWSDLIRAGRLPGIPVDPTGAPLVLDASGRVTVSTDSALHPLPNRPVPSGS
jgi:tetratricopeptide (TPR) repeat protein